MSIRNSARSVKTPTPKRMNDPDTQTRAAFDALLSNPARFRKLAKDAAKNGGLNRALAKECGCATGTAQKYLNELGLSAGRRCHHRHGADFARWLELKTALEDIIRATDDAQFENRDSKREAVNKLYDVYALILGNVPWSEPRAD